MVAETYPSGTSAVHPDWPEARFNISGMCVYDRVLMQLLDIVRQRFDCCPRVESMHGAPAVPWNAGRPSMVAFSPDQLDQSLQWLYARNVGYFPTFTNHLLDANDLANPAGNLILELINQRPDLNGVIVGSEVLSRYIAERYPRLRQVASIIMATFAGNAARRLEFYREAGRRFHRYVLHPDDCRDLSLLDQLDRDKAEIIVNENCIVDCPNRALHYEMYARQQKAFGTPEQQATAERARQMTAKCRSPLLFQREDNRDRSCNLTRGEMKAIYDLGFRHFKLQGRKDDPFAYLYDVTRYMLEPEVVCPLVYKSLTRCIRKVPETAGA